jgi:hypothetical protein
MPRIEGCPSRAGARHRTSDVGRITATSSEGNSNGDAPKPEGFECIAVSVAGLGHPRI